MSVLLRVMSHLPYK